MSIRFFHGCLFVCGGDYFIKGVLPSVVCLSVIMEPKNKETISHWGCFHLGVRD